jgi:Tfp pilus assembly protein PilO
VAAPSGNRRRWLIDRSQLLVLAVAAVMVGSFSWFVLWPRHEELTALASAVERERQTAAQKVRTSRDGGYLGARIAGLRKARRWIERRLPIRADLSDWLGEVARCVDAEAEVTHEVQRLEQPPATGTPAVPVRLRLRGSFEAAYRCLAAVERLERLSCLRSVHVGRAGDDGRVVVDAEVLVYHLPLEDGIPAAAAQAEAAAAEEDCS